MGGNEPGGQPSGLGRRRRYPWRTVVGPCRAIPIPQIRCVTRSRVPTRRRRRWRWWRRWRRKGRPCRENYLLTDVQPKPRRIPARLKPRPAANAARAYFTSVGPPSLCARSCRSSRDFLLDRLGRARMADDTHVADADLVRPSPPGSYHRVLAAHAAHAGRRVTSPFRDDRWIVTLCADIAIRPPRTPRVETRPWMRASAAPAIGFRMVWSPCSAAPFSRTIPLVLCSLPALYLCRPGPMGNEKTPVPAHGWGVNEPPRPT